MKLSHKAFCCARGLALAALFVFAAAGGFAKDATLNYLKAGKPDAASLLAPPPLPESAEAAADLDEVRAIYHSAGSNDVAAAYAEKGDFDYAESTEREALALVEANTRPSTQELQARLATRRTSRSATGRMWPRGSNYRCAQ